MFSTAFKAFIASAIVLSSVVAAKDRANTMVSARVGCTNRRDRRQKGDPGGQALSSLETRIGNWIGDVEGYSNVLKERSTTKKSAEGTHVTFHFEDVGTGSNLLRRTRFSFFLHSPLPLTNF